MGRDEYKSKLLMFDISVQSCDNEGVNMKNNLQALLKNRVNMDSVILCQAASTYCLYACGRNTDALDYL